MTLQKRNITVEKAKSEQYSQILQKKKKKKRKLQHENNGWDDLRGSR